MVGRAKFPMRDEAITVSCQMACCGMCNVLVSIARLPTDPLTKWSFGGLVIAPSTLDIVQQPSDS